MTSTDWVTFHTAPYDRELVARGTGTFLPSLLVGGYGGGVRSRRAAVSLLRGSRPPVIFEVAVATASSGRMLSEVERHTSRIVAAKRRLCVRCSR